MESIEGCPACGALPIDWSGGANPHAFSPDLKADNAALREALLNVQPMIDHAIEMEGLSEPCEAEVLCGSSVCEYAGCIIDKAVAIRHALQATEPRP